MLEVYGIPNCNTVKKTLHYLEEEKIEFVFHNFKKNILSETLLQQWIHEKGLGNILNKKGTTYKNLPEKEKELLENKSTSIAVCMQYPSVIKRPIIIKENKIVQIGFADSLQFAP